jgi:hypothetical protein
MDCWEPNALLALCITSRKPYLKAVDETCASLLLSAVDQRQLSTFSKIETIWQRSTIDTILISCSLLEHAGVEDTSTLVVFLDRKKFAADLQ